MTNQQRLYHFQKNMLNKFLRLRTKLQTHLESHTSLGKKINWYNFKIPHYKEFTHLLFYLFYANLTFKTC